VDEDAEVIGEEGEEADDEEDEEEMEAGAEEEMEASEETAMSTREYDDSAYMKLKWDDKPSDAWFDRQKIEKHKVNMILFDQYAKPRSFFPIKLQPGDTVRISYTEPYPTSTEKNIKDYKSYKPKDMKTSSFTGVILAFKGQYHTRKMVMRTMAGSMADAMGMELTFPMHSPCLKSIQVLRRGFIGRNKNAYFMRGMLGRKNVIPEDKDRAGMDKIYKELADEGRKAEIPVADYPQLPRDRYPLPRSVQDDENWDESMYAPENVDTRSEYELRILARARLNFLRKTRGNRVKARCRQEGSGLPMQLKTGRMYPQRTGRNANWDSIQHYKLKSDRSQWWIKADYRASKL